MMTSRLMVTGPVTRRFVNTTPSATAKIPPLDTTVLEPSASALASINWDGFRTISPVNVLAPERVNVPLPTFTTEPAPVNAPLKVNAELLARLRLALRLTLPLPKMLLIVSALLTL